MACDGGPTDAASWASWASSIAEVEAPVIVSTTSYPNHDPTGRYLSVRYRLRLHVFPPPPGAVYVNVEYRYVIAGLAGRWDIAAQTTTACVITIDDLRPALTYEFRACGVDGFGVAGSPSPAVLWRGQEDGGGSGLVQADAAMSTSNETVRVDEAQHLRRDLATARETIARLNRRCQKAEGALGEKLSRLGLFNAGLAVCIAQRDDARVECDQQRNQLGAIHDRIEAITRRHDLHPVEGLHPLEWDILQRLGDYVDQLKKECGRLRDACIRQNEEVSQALGRVLGYPWFKDDQEHFPGATDADGVFVGDHVAETLAEAAARWITSQRALLAEAFGVLDDLAARWHSVAHGDLPDGDEVTLEIEEYLPAAVALCQTPRCRRLLDLVERLRVAGGVTELPARGG